MLCRGWVPAEGFGGGTEGSQDQCHILPFLRWNAEKQAQTGASLVAQLVKNPPAMQETLV